MPSLGTRDFLAETKQLLDLMIHSVYTNKEIFLRELLSNASDAIDKIRLQALTNPDILGDNFEFAIYIRTDKQRNTVSISDNGIGMTYEEAIDNLGTIAKSGTKDFLEKLKNQEKTKECNDLIGQFGVGFYSSFMVADHIDVVTHVVGEERGVRWRSSGEGKYSIEYVEKSERGTTVTLTLKEEYRQQAKPEEDFLNPYTLQNLVKRYSDYIRYPIKMDFIKEENPKNKDGTIIENGQTETIIDTRIVNSMKPIWERRSKEIKKEEYFQFYKHVFHDWNEPLDVIHFKAEGKIEYIAFLFIPTYAPMDFYSPTYQKGIKLYSRNVFVLDNCQSLLPQHLKFVTGVVESPDFSLNISREILQHDTQLKLIGKHLEKKTIEALKKMLQKERTQYERFWDAFGKALKGGIYMEYKNKESLQDLMLFSSSQMKEGLTTLKEYLERAPENQKEIYYATGRDRDSIEHSPQFEVFKYKNIEVLYFFDKIDEFMIRNLDEYGGRKLRSIRRGDLTLHDSTKGEVKESDQKPGDDTNGGFDDVIKAIKLQLGSKVDEVRLSKRLKTSAVCLVSDETGTSINMEMLLRGTSQRAPRAKRILEINPDHRILPILKGIYQRSKNGDLKLYSELLLSQALLIEGTELENPIEFANQLSELMVKITN